MPTWLTRAQRGASAGATLGALFEGVGAGPGALAGAAVAVGWGAASDWWTARTVARLNAAVPGAEIETVVPARK